MVINITVLCLHNKVVIPSPGLLLPMTPLAAKKDGYTIDLPSPAILLLFVQALSFSWSFPSPDLLLLPSSTCPAVCQ